MVQIVDLGSLIGKYSDRVRLTPFSEEGEIKMFGCHTHRLSKEIYEDERKFNATIASFNYERNRYIRQHCHEALEFKAKLGAVAADKVGENGVVYDLGCGIGISSIACSLLTSNAVISIDYDRHRVRKAGKLARLVGSQIKLVAADATRYLKKRNLSTSDVVLVAGPQYSLKDYWKELLRNYEFTLVLACNSDVIDPKANRYVPILQLRAKLDDFINEHFTAFGFGVLLGSPEVMPSGLVLIASKTISQNE